MLRMRWLLWSLLTLCGVRTVLAQAPGAGAAGRETGGRLVMVLPFENRSGQTNLDWIGDSFPVTLNSRLTSAGFLTITRDDRQFALDHLGLPVDFRPTRATTIRIAQTLDADYVVVGNFNVTAGRIAVQAQVLAVNQLRMSRPLDDANDLERLFDCENAIAWKVARQIDPKFSVALQTFLAASAGVRLSAFENYIRGTDAPTPVERIKRLQAAVADTPTYAAALLDLGKTQYMQRQYVEAAATLAKIPPNDRRALEAGFYLGLARFNLAKYADAETAFGFVASRLPLPEVVNNQGVAASRQGKDAAALFQRVISTDPNDEDYVYNLAVALFQRGDAPGALREVEAGVKLKPGDIEAAEFRTRLAAAVRLTGTPLKTSVGAGGFDPLPRIRRTYTEASFRQAAFQLDQMRAMRLATLPAAEQGMQYTQLGQDYLVQGLVPEAEQEFQAAIAADPNNAPAHVGLAQVREQSGSAEEARAEAQTALRLKPGVAAYLVLARLDLRTNNLGGAASDVGNALRLEPGNTAAQGMRQALLARGQTIP